MQQIKLCSWKMNHLEGSSGGLLLIFKVGAENIIQIKVNTVKHVFYVQLYLKK